MKKFKPMWEIRQQAENGVLNIYLYGDVEAETCVNDGWWGYLEESQNSANHFREVLSQNPNVSQINLYINSYGGSVFEGTAIYNQLRRHAAHKTAYIDGFCCSIASVIAMACDEVVMPRNALMMIHNMWMSATGSAAELRKAADDLDVINAAGRAAYLERAGEKLTEEELVVMMDAETWLTAERCMEIGFADRYAENDADMSNAETVLQKANLNLTQRINIQKGLAAQLRDLTSAPLDQAKDPTSQEPETNTTKDNAGSPPADQESQQNTILNLFTKF